MIFTEGLYFIVLIALFFIYWIAAEKESFSKLKAVFLATASGFIYAQSGIKPLLLLLLLSFLDFTISRLMAVNEDKNKRRLLLCSSLLIDLGALGFLKYANFFLDSTNDLLLIFGIDRLNINLNLIVPLGISFFIFQSIAYVVDVYRKETEPAKNFFEYFGFVAFFPSIVAGPIVRAKQFLPQLRQKSELTIEDGGKALFLIGLGLVKKIAIADYLSVNLVDRVFDFPERFSSVEVLFAVYAYAVQIYADFSGYSDVAIGSALLFGIKLPVNFNAPYISKDLPEFWRRWHISLSNWLRDYLFFSISSIKPRSAVMLYAGLVITMLIGGLWHGATWNFVIWGLMHGFALAAYRLYTSSKKQADRKLNFLPSWLSSAASIFITFNFVCFTWIFFRTDTFMQALAVVKQIAAFSWDTSNLALPVAIVVAIAMISHFIPENIFKYIQEKFIELPAVGQAALLVMLAIGLYFIASSDVVPFIYARF